MLHIFRKDANIMRVLADYTIVDLAFR